jgi:hypothetical protein
LYQIFKQLALGAYLLGCANKELALELAQNVHQMLLIPNQVWFFVRAQNVSRSLG